MSDQEALESVEKGPGNFGWYWVNPPMTGPAKPLITSEITRCQTGRSSSSCVEGNVTLPGDVCHPSSALVPLSQLRCCLHPFLPRRRGAACGLRALGTNVLGTVALCCVFIIII